MTHCQYCHKPIIPDMPGMCPKLITAFGEDDTFIVHEHCVREIQEKMSKGKTEEGKNIILFKILKLMSMCLVFVCLSLHADQNDKSTWVKGAVVIGVSSEGSCYFKPFVAVDSIQPDDEGNAQLLGYSPGSVVIARDGSIIYERVEERRFIRLGGAKIVKGRLCKAPAYNE